MHGKRQLTQFFEVPHTADAAIEVFGRSLDELFATAVLGMLSIMKIIPYADGMKKESIILTENDLESLMVAFLSEILFMIEKKRYPSNIQVNIENFQLKSTFQSFPIKSSGKEIKAVTFNQLNIKFENGQFKTYLVFDI